MDEPTLSLGTVAAAILLALGVFVRFSTSRLSLDADLSIYRANRATLEGPGATDDDRDHR